MSEKKFLDQNGLDYFWEKIKSKFISSFNGRTGAVTSQKGDYTASMVGAAAQYDMSSMGYVEQIAWYRIATLTLNTNVATYLVNVFHTFFSGSPSSVTLLLTFDPVSSKIVVLDYAFNKSKNIITVDDVRIVQTGTEGVNTMYGLDIHYTLAAKNSIRVSWIPINTYAKVNILSFAEPEKIDALPETSKVLALAEWVSPPMLLGIEYRTSEMYNRKPVYAKLVSLGKLPNSGSVSVEHNSENVETIIFGNLVNQEGTLLNIYPNIKTFSIGRQTINLVTVADMSSNIGTVLMKYTKTTN